MARPKSSGTKRRQSVAPAQTVGTRRNRGLRTGSVAVALLAAAAGGLAWWLNRDEPSPPVPPEADRRAASTLELPRMPFSDQTAAAGIDFVHENGAAGEKLLPETMGGGVGVLDFDADGHPDLLFVNSQRWPWQTDGGLPAATCALYRNDGTGRFAEVSQAAGLDVGLYGMGCAIGDYDNDGDPDVFMSALGPNRLFRNDGGRFVDVTAAAGVAGNDDAWSTSCGWFDYDGDGRLDLFVCNYIEWTREIDLAQNFRLRGSGMPAYGRPQSFTGAFPQLFRNKGDGRFEEVGRSAGVQIVNRSDGFPRAKSLGLTFADFDQDGDLDVVVANDTVPNMLFENRGDGTFAEIAAAAGIALDPAGNVRGAMGADVADLRGGTETAIAIGNFADEMTAFYVSRQGKMQFTDEAPFNGLGPLTQRELTFGVLLADFDLDGRQDLFAANGHLEPDVNRVRADQHYRQPAQLFWNCSTEQATRFCLLNEESLGKEFFQPAVGRGAAYADFDGDGDLDLVMTAAGMPARLQRNDLAGRRRWLRLKLVGSASNRDAIGATARVTEGGLTQAKTVMPTRSYLSQVEPVLTFGFGGQDLDKPVERLEIRWPSGQTTLHEQLAPGRTHVIEEPAA